MNCTRDCFAKGHSQMSTLRGSQNLNPGQCRQKHKSRVGLREYGHQRTESREREQPHPDQTKDVIFRNDATGLRRRKAMPRAWSLRLSPCSGRPAASGLGPMTTTARPRGHPTSVRVHGGRRFTAWYWRYWGSGTESVTRTGQFSSCWSAGAAVAAIKRFEPQMHSRKHPDSPCSPPPWSGTIYQLGSAGVWQDACASCMSDPADSRLTASGQATMGSGSSVSL